MMKKKAQSITEYVTLIAVIAAALTMMQLYFQRSVRAVIKIAADEAGEQKKGSTAADYVKWKEKTDSVTFTDSAGENTETKLNQGAVIYGKNETAFQYGVASWGWWQPKE